MRIFLTVLCLASLAGAAVPVGESFTLGVGESVEVGGAGLVVGFTSILADSRCPMDAYCFWAGDAEAGLWASLPIENVDHFGLHTTVEPHAYTYEFYQIKLLWVAPYPMSSSVPIPPETYEVMLVVLSSLPSENELATWSTVKALYR